jgi:hypothetical protein
MFKVEVTYTDHTKFTCFYVIFIYVVKSSYCFHFWSPDGVNVYQISLLFSSKFLTFSDWSTHICAVKGKVEVAKVHIFVQSGI